MAIEWCRASREERRYRLPGDDLLPQPMAVITHAITINAPPAVVWPWLVQLGAGRAGWYSYDHIDNGGRRSARRIIPQLQQIAIGQILPAVPGAQDAFVVKEVILGSALILVVPLEPVGADSAAASGGSAPPLRVSWALVLKPLDQGRTRLISRGCVSRDWLAGQQPKSVAPGKPIFIERIYGVLARLPHPLLLLVAGLGHYFMESRMLRGIKRRAESRWAKERRHATEFSRPAAMAGEARPLAKEV
jgi:hypothetical protein